MTPIERVQRPRLAKKPKTLKQIYKKFAAQIRKENDRIKKGEKWKIEIPAGSLFAYPE
jgi:hypothetical protein